MDGSQLLVSLGIGLGLSAACGFRIFVPLLALGIAARADMITPAADFAWLASTPALIAFGAAALIEVAGYFIPWLDHALDVIATPAAMLAGIVATAAVFGDFPPLVRWSAAIIAGGGTAGLVQTATVLTRIKSTAFTGGIANPLLAVTELGASSLTSFIAITLPAFMLVFVVLSLGTLVWFSRRARRGGKKEPNPPPGA